jgi:hypothetical protein
MCSANSMAWSVEVGEIHGACIVHWVIEKCTQQFGQEIWKELSTCGSTIVDAGLFGNKLQFSPTSEVWSEIIREQWDWEDANSSNLPNEWKLRLLVCNLNSS